MPVTDTPLRYPGGKSQLIPFVLELMKGNGLYYGEYAEPFAGGAGIAMKLLLNNFVSKIYLNDFDPSIYALWHSILYKTDELCKKIESTEVCIGEWHKQRKIYLKDSFSDPLSKGYATLFLNRTNRSGIIKAGVIGGLGQQGNYKLDCRFSKNDIVRKIRRIAEYREQIVLTCLDASVFIAEKIPKTSKNTLVNLDPPYFDKGKELYSNFYQPEDHADLARAVKKIKRPWMVTYDDTREIRALYRKFPMYSLSLNYSAQVKRVGCELLMLEPTLKAPFSIRQLHIQDSEFTE